MLMELFLSHENDWQNGSISVDLQISVEYHRKQLNYDSFSVEKNVYHN